MPCCLCFCIIVLVLHLYRVVRGSIRVLRAVVEVLFHIFGFCLPLLLSLLDTLLLDVPKCSVDSPWSFLRLSSICRSFFSLPSLRMFISACSVSLPKSSAFRLFSRSRFCFNLKGFLVGFVLLLGCFLTVFAAFHVLFHVLSVPFGCTSALFALLADDLSSFSNVLPDSFEYASFAALYSSLRFKKLSPYVYLVFARSNFYASL